VRGEQRSFLASVRDYSSTHFGVRRRTVSTRRPLFSVSERGGQGPPSRRRRIDPENGFEVLEAEGEGDSPVRAPNLDTAHFAEVEDRLDFAFDPDADLGLAPLPDLEDPGVEEDDYYDAMAAQQNQVDQMQQVIDALKDELATIKARQRKPDPPRNLTFKGTPSENWDEFIVAYRNHMAAQEYEPKLAVRYLFGCMKDRAMTVTRHFDHTTDDFEAYVKKYEALFLPPAASKMAIQEFKQARQGAKEPVTAFHARLLALWNRAYPDSILGTVQDAKHKAHIETTLIDSFIEGLHNAKVRMYVRERKVPTFDEAMQAALDELSYLTGESLGAGRPLPAGVDVLEIGAMDMSKIKCFNCKNVGHVAANCWKKKNFKQKTSSSSNSSTFKKTTGTKPKTSFKKINYMQKPGGFKKRRVFKKRSDYRRFIKAFEEIFGEPDVPEGKKEDPEEPPEGEGDSSEEESEEEEEAEEEEEEEEPEKEESESKETKSENF